MKKRKIKESPGELIFLAVIVIFILILSAIFLYPLIYVISMSISDSMSVASRKVFLLPKGFHLDAYELIIKRKDVWTAYYNTFFYTITGTLINVVLTMCFSYPLSRKNFVFRRQLTVMMAITMWFSGGMIPSFILINKLHIYNTRWAMILPGAILAWNVIITRTFLSTTIPDALIESAKIDGANDIIVFSKIVLPLSKSIIAVNTLFYAVGHWNNFFRALLYLPNPKLQPLQIFLRNILFAEQMLSDSGSGAGADYYLLAEKLKYAVIVFSILPILCIYPFVQKHFVKGVTIGSVKG